MELQVPSTSGQARVLCATQRYGTPCLSKRFAIALHSTFPVDSWSQPLWHARHGFTREGVALGANEASLHRLGTAVLQEQHDEWQDGKRAFSLASMKLVLAPDDVGKTNLLTEGLVA